MSFNAFITNKAIWLPLLSWLAAQIYKFIAEMIAHRTIDFRKLVGAGGMPSSHSAIAMCLATVLGKQNGLDSGIFALSLIFAFVVMFDAAGVRHAAGKQAEVLNKLVYHTGVIRLDKELKELLGHTPKQVLVGAILGIAVGAVFG